MHKPGYLLVATALIAGPALANTPAPRPDSGKKICVKEAKIGTRLTRKRCLTEAQWAEMRRESRELTQWLQAIGDIAGSR